MLNSNVLDIIFGLIFIYLILSLFASAINELVMRWLYSRGKNLKKGIIKLLSDNAEKPEGLAQKFLETPLFRKFCRSDSSLPSYLTDRRFAEIVIFILNGEDYAQQTIEGVRQAIEALPGGDTKKWLLALVNEAGNDLNKFSEQLQSWYNDVMERATGWYKRKAHLFLFIIGFIISVVVDADTFQIVHTLNNDPAARTELVKMAELQLTLMSADSAQTVKDYSLDSLPENQNNARIDQLEHRIDSLFTHQISQTQSILGLGWEIPKTRWVTRNGKKIEEETTTGEKIKSIWDQITFLGFLGWLITAVAVSLGAPFWFDLLNRVASLRSSGQRPASKSSTKEKGA